jgi:hypothetical protein
MSNLLKRYDELLAVSLTDNQWIQGIVKEQKRVILAIDGMQLCQPSFFGKYSKLVSDAF